MTPTSLTSAPEAVNFFDRSVNQGLRTETSTQGDLNYKDVDTPLITDAKPAGVQNTISEPRKASQGGAGLGAGRRFRGVVDQVGHNSSNVTLFYDGRENEFVLPTPVLEGVGIAYIGALFEIVMKKEFGLNSYDIVHLHDEEMQARREAGVADLSFLDGLEARARQK